MGYIPRTQRGIIERWEESARGGFMQTGVFASVSNSLLRLVYSSVYSSARYNCTIVSRDREAAANKTNERIKERKAERKRERERERESQEPLKPVDHAYFSRDTSLRLELNPT